TGVAGGSGRFTDSVDTDVGLANVTFGQNVAIDGATIAYDTTASNAPDSALLSLNNVTMIRNEGGTGTGGIRALANVAVVVSNTLLADNTGGGADPDCDLAASLPDDTRFNRNYYANGSACPGLRHSNANP